MEKYTVHKLNDTEFSIIVTVLDYETRINSYLSELVVSPIMSEKKVLLDLALKAGVNEYRFVEFDVDKEGKIILNSNRYVIVSEKIEKIANQVLQQQKEIVYNSILTDTQKNMILC